MEASFETFENPGDIRKYNFQNVRHFQSLLNLITTWSVVYNIIFEM